MWATNDDGRDQKSIIVQPINFIGEVKIAVNFTIAPEVQMLCCVDEMNEDTVGSWYLPSALSAISKHFQIAKLYYGKIN